MGEQSHAQQQIYHYQALRDPHYKMEFITDCLYEDIMMSMPTSKNEQVYQKDERPEWAPKQWDAVQQIQLAIERLYKLYYELEGGKDITSKRKVKY